MFVCRLETVHRADFALLEGNGTIVGVKTGGHTDGEVWGYWAVRLEFLCVVNLRVTCETNGLMMTFWCVIGDWPAGAFRSLVCMGWHGSDGCRRYGGAQEA